MVTIRTMRTPTKQKDTHVRVPLSHHRRLRRIARRHRWSVKAALMVAIEALERRAEGPAASAGGGH